ncbi:MAG: DOMON-like domain-containing protein [Sphingobium sp.]|nr:DOMON-like domain-containing protein [Sphingobium sp.]MCP5398703.1 DOMON-like domain-containing protein [Sphingomonas sp.]
MDNIASLVCHPDTPGDAVREIIVSGTRGQGGFITIRYHVVGDISRIKIPAAADSIRTDNLWETTCFELYTRDVGEQAYREYNFSPSTQWAAYSFAAYRDGMEPVDIWAPRISITVEKDALIQDVTFVSPRVAPQQVGASAVIEETDGRKSYWALTHPAGQPDFHHPDCFAYMIPSVD